MICCWVEVVLSRDLFFIFMRFLLKIKFRRRRDSCRLANSIGDIFADSDSFADFCGEIIAVGIFVGKLSSKISTSMINLSSHPSV